MPVPAVIRVLVLVVIPVVALLIVQLGLQTVFHELRDSVFEQFLNVIHAAYIRQLQQLTNFFATRVSSWDSFPSCHCDYIRHSASILHLVGGFHKVWDGVRPI